MLLPNFICLVNGDEVVLVVFQHLNQFARFILIIQEGNIFRDCSSCSSIFSKENLLL